jgi:serine/threonine protein kinase
MYLELFDGGKPNYEGIRVFLLECSQDSVSFFSRHGSSLTDAVKLYSDRFKLTQEPLVGSLLVGLLGIQASESVSNFGRLSRAHEEEKVQTVNQLLRVSGVAEHVALIFRPEPFDQSEDSWNCIQWSTLRLFRFGTTSMIFRVEDKAGTDNALKLIHMLFRKIGPIASASRDALGENMRLRSDCRDILPRIIGSGEGWILSEFVKGSTLAEFVAERSSGHASAHDRFKLLADTMIPIVRSVAILHNAAKNHGDLSPSNIILRPQPDGGISAILIDLGRNFLASNTIGRVVSPDGRYSAPEVLALEADEPIVGYFSDLFSLGQLIPVCLGFEIGPHDSLIPNQVLALEPILGRIIADLSDPDPNRRFSLHGAATESPLASFEAWFPELVSSLIAASSNNTLKKGFRPGPKGLAVDAKQFANLVKNEKLKSLRSFRYLTFFELLAKLSLFTTLFLCSATLFWDYPNMVDFFGIRTTIGWLLKETRHFYAVPTSIETGWEIRIVGTSYAIASYSYYSTIFQRLSYVGATKKWLAYLGEILLRLVTICVSPFVVTCVFFRPDDWLVFTLGGLFVVAFSNVVTYFEGRWVQRRVDKLMNTSERFPYWDSLGDDGIRGWAETMSVYFLIVSMIVVWDGRFPIAGKDRLLFSMVFFSINIGLLTWSHVFRQGPHLREQLYRSTILGERVLLRSKSEG